MAAPHSKHKRTRDKRKAKQELRAKDTRVQSALSAARESEARLAARMKLEAAQEEMRRTSQAEVKAYDHDLPAATKTKAHKAAAEASARLAVEFDREQRRERWPLGEARALLRQGYTLEHCIWYTGWDAEFFDGALEVGVHTGQVDPFPCAKCGLDLVEIKPVNGKLNCPRCGHTESV